MSEHRKALVVAIDRYVHPTLRQLAAPAADAAELAEVLSDPQLGDFDVSVLANANSSQVAEAVEALLADCVPSDVVLLHFSCHGIKDDSGELFLAATNTMPNRLFATAVNASVVYRLIQRSRAQRVILLLDCCYGGAFERGVVARAGGHVDVAGHFGDTVLGGGRGRVVITASSAMEYAFEGAVLAENSGPSPSLFTAALVNGIRSGEADRDQDGQVALGELYDYVHDKVRERTPNQTPSKWEFGVQGELYVARNPHRRVIPAPLRDVLQELVDHANAKVRLTAVEELDRLSSGPKLQLAAGARAALRELQNDDSRRVSMAATRSLKRTAIRVVPNTVDLGRVPTGSTRQVELRIEGSPLATASAAESSTDSVRTQIEGAVLRIFATAGESGSLDGVVTLSGPAGDVQVAVTGTVQSASPASAAPSRSSRRSPSSPQDRSEPTVMAVESVPETETAASKSAVAEPKTTSQPITPATEPKPADPAASGQVARADAPGTQEPSLKQLPRPWRNGLTARFGKLPPRAQIGLGVGAVAAAVAGTLLTAQLATDHTDSDNSSAPTPTSTDSGLPTSKALTSSQLIVPMTDEKNLTAGVDLYLADTDGSRTLLITSPGDQTLPTLSPDRKTMIYRNFPLQAGTTSEESILWVAAVDGSGARPLFETDLLQQDCSHRPAWNAVSHKLAAVCGPKGQPKLFLMETDGLSRQQLPTGPVKSVGDPTFSPDGTRVAYLAQKLDGTRGIFTVGVADNNEAEQVTTGNDNDPVWSPAGDGNIAFRRADPGLETAQIFVVNADGGDVACAGPSQTNTTIGGEICQLTDTNVFNQDPSWSVDADSIAFKAGSDDANIMVVPADGGSDPTMLWAGDLGGQEAPAWTAR